MCVRRMEGLQEEKGIAAFLSRAVTVQRFENEINAPVHARVHAGDGMSEFGGLQSSPNPSGLPTKG